MNGGEFSKEVLEIFRSGEIPQSVANRMLMAGMIETYRKQETILVVLNGSDGKIGLVAKVLANTKAKVTMQRLGWGIFTALVVDVLVRVF